MRRGSRPSLRLWSTKRPNAAAVDPLRIWLQFDGVPPPSKAAHGNNDTRLGRWLHNSRTPATVDDRARHSTTTAQTQPPTIVRDSSSGHRMGEPASNTTGTIPADNATEDGTIARFTTSQHTESGRGAGSHWSTRIHPVVCSSPRSWSGLP